MRWCPETGAGAEKLVHSWPKKPVCARKPEHKSRFLARGGENTLREAKDMGYKTKILRARYLI